MIPPSLTVACSGTATATGYDECGLLVRQGNFCERAENAGFVDEADLQWTPRRKAMATKWWP